MMAGWAETCSGNKEKTTLHIDGITAKRKVKFNYNIFLTG
jgi:hypothetical protein